MTTGSSGVDNASNPTWVVQQQQAIQQTYQETQADEATDFEQIESQILSNINGNQETDAVASTTDTELQALQQAQQQQQQQQDSTSGDTTTQSAVASRRALRSVNQIQ